MQVSTARPWIVMVRACLLVFGLVSCGDGGTTPKPQVQVSVSPVGPLTLNIGDTVTVRATVQNATRTDVSFSSSNPTVATVSATGLVTALAAGTASVTAASLEDPRATASVQVQVNPDRPASVIIEAVLNTANLPVDPTHVQGVVFAQIALERGKATRLDVTVDTSVVCQQFFTATTPTAPVSLKCPINTAAFDSITGTPRLFNGAAKLSARLVGADDRVLASHAGLQVVLANPNQVVASIGAASQANDSTGLRWVDGDVTVGVLPVMFDRQIAASRVEVGYRSPAGSLTVLADNAAPFAITFSDRLTLAGLTDPAMQFMINTITTAGNLGPGGTTTPIRYDNEAPVPGALRPRDWIGAQWEFTRSYDPSTEVERGVGRIRMRFFAGDPGLSAAQLITRGREVTRGGDLAQAAAGTYRLAAELCDALGNCAVAEGFTFGVDLTPPTVESISLPNRVINPREALELRLQDDFSGFDSRPVEASVQLLDRSSLTLPCGPVVDGVDLPGRTIRGSCVPDSVGTRLPVPQATPGYYTYTVTALDRAGNRATTLSREILVDQQAPTINSVSLPAQLTSGDDAVFGAEVADNLDLAEVAFRLTYARGGQLGSLALPFGAPYVAGVAFDSTLTASATAAARLPFVRTLTFGSGGSSRSTVVVDSVQVTVTDAAQLRARASRLVTRSSFGSDTTTVDPFPSLSLAAASVDRTVVCTERCEPSDGTALRISVRLTGDTQGGAPFARMFFYRRGEDGVVMLLGSTDRVETVATGTQRTFTYQLDFTPPAGLVGDYHILAAGVTSRGNAMLSDLAGPVRFFRR